MIQPSASAGGRGDENAGADAESPIKVGQGARTVQCVRSAWNAIFVAFKQE